MSENTNNITVDYRKLDEILSLYFQVKRFSEYEENDVVDRAVAAKQAKAIEKVMDILGINYETAQWDIIEGWIFE